MKEFKGRELKELFNVDAQHAFYDKNGKWYHHLKKFPGVLFDRKGYVRFSTQQEYLNCRHLQFGKTVHVPSGISSIAKYVSLKSLSKMVVKKSHAKGKSSTAQVKQIEESAEHRRLKAAVKEVILASGLKVDTEAHLNFSGSTEEDGKLSDECSIDVAGFGMGEDGKKFLVIFEWLCL
jgi:5-methylcytosine-specific restriction protein A